MNKKINRYFLLTLIVVYCLRFDLSIAETVSTPDPGIQIFPDILINEVSFKNSANDWMELYIKNDMNSGRGANIKGLKINDDTDFFKITNDLMVHTDDYIIINFKSETESFSDTGNVITFNIKRSGLTGTTEQVVIKNALNEMTDAVCWANSTPTDGEISDFNEIAEVSQWTQNISSCISSDEVPSNNSIYRKNLTDTNSKNDWGIQASDTKGTTNIAAPAQNLTATPDPTSSATAVFIANNISDEEETETTTNPAEIRNTCVSIFINEFLPNPEGTDTGNEWIELYNPDDECIMDGWIIDDLEGGSKPFYIYNEKVLSNGFLLLPSWKTKISLNNSEDSVRLFNNENVLTEKTDYKNAKENQSYAKNSENLFEWTTNPTPLGKNIFPESHEDEDEDDEAEKTFTKTTTSKSSSSKTAAKGDLSDNIFITELFPNPKGTDKGNEWIEIYNDSDEKINLGAWYLDLGEESSKKYIFSDIMINSREFLILSDADMGLTLKNTNGQIRLLDYEEKLIDSIDYGSAPENSSYMKITIISGNDNEYEWKWTLNSTRGEENQTLYKYTGTITLIDEKTGSLELAVNETQEKVRAKFIQSGDELFTADLKTGAEAEMIFSKTETDDFILEDFQILNNPEENAGSENQGLIYIVLSSLPPAGMLGYYGIKKFGLIKFTGS